MFKKANGAYVSVETPSVCAMNAPHVFHGTNTDVSVPASSSDRDRFFGSRCCRA